MKALKQYDDLNVDERAALFESDPKLFEKIAQEAIDQVYDTCRTPEDKTKLRRFQWNINKALGKSKTHSERVMIFQDLFGRYVYGNEGFLLIRKYGALEIQRILADQRTILKCMRR